MAETKFTRLGLGRKVAIKLKSHGIPKNPNDIRLWQQQAEKVSKDEDMRDAAAICSKFCTRLFPGLEVLHEGIQNESRTVMFTHSSSAPLIYR